jgi:hypothetical protein
MVRLTVKSLAGKIYSLAFICVFCLQGCSSQKAEILNPFAETPTTELGERSNKALLENGSAGNDADKARHALEVMNSYQRAQDPQPYKPVVVPREVRLMWVPDHINKNGDLIPAHYYYLNVLNDRWAVTDAFDIEKQLNQGSGKQSSAVPWVFK